MIRLWACRPVSNTVVIHHVDFAACYFPAPARLIIRCIASSLMAGTQPLSSDDKWFGRVPDDVIYDYPSI